MSPAWKATAFAYGFAVIGFCLLLLAVVRREGFAPPSSHFISAGSLAFGSLCLQLLGSMAAIGLAATSPRSRMGELLPLVFAAGAIALGVVQGGFGWLLLCAVNGRWSPPYCFF